MALMMKPVELGELYALLEMYRRAYGGVEEELIAQIKHNYNRSAASYHCSPENGVVPPVTNPRAAGRKPRQTPEETGRIMQLREQGLPIRTIAVETGCSIGYVHKLINEQSRKSLCK